MSETIRLVVASADNEGRATVAHNVQYALVDLVLLWFVDLKRYSLDSLFRRKTELRLTN